MAPYKKEMCGRSLLHHKPMMMKRTRFLLKMAAVSVAGTISCTTLHGGDRDKPNVLVILVDDLGKEWISAYGAEDVRTPHVDQLAETGLLFENFYVMPQCTPSRVTLLTGQYPFRHGWVNHWDVPRWGGGVHFDSDKNPSLGRLMKSAGYKTAAAGKWQIDDFRVVPEAMTMHGFDAYCMWTGFEAENPPSAERFWNPYIHTAEGSKTHEGSFGDDVFSDFLIDFMKSNAQDPMFLYYAMCLTHPPFTDTPAEPGVNSKYGRHRAMVRYMDALVGKMVHALDELGLRERTIIIFATDNGTVSSLSGTMRGQKVVGGKSSTEEPGICVPFIVNCPGLVPAGKTTALGDLTDILPTCAQIGGAELPGQYTVDGTSLMEVFLGKSADSPRKWIMAMGGDGNGSKAALSPVGMENEYRFRDRVVRDKSHKLYVSSDRKPVKLVLMTDGTEGTDNLLESPDAQHVAAYRKLWSAVELFPEQDADPHYVPLARQPWDTQITVASQTWKK